jgi:Fe-S oxidoreductase
MAWATGVKKYDGDEYLLYLGCESCYPERGREMAKNVIAVLKATGVSFGVLGNEEECDGNEAYMLGELGLFQELAFRNAKKFKELGVKRVVVVSPHAYNSMKKYPERGFEVLHFTQLLHQLVQRDKLTLSGVEYKVTYHDPCFLGRYNQVYLEPRRVLQSIPGLKLIEMRRSKENAFCCGGGSGNFVFDLLHGLESPARVRVREALETGAEVLAVACPICKCMLDDAVKDESLEGKIEVKDLAEIVLDAMKRC